MFELPVSKQYLHELEELYKAHAEKRITDEELSQQSDALREKEAKLHEHMGHALLLQKLGEIEKIAANEVKEKVEQEQQELKAKEQRLQMDQRLQREREQREARAEKQRLLDEQRRREKEREIFRSEVDADINKLERNAQTWQFRYTWLQIGLLVFSALTATLAGIDGVPRAVVAAAGFLATIAGGFLTTFKIQDRIYASRKAIAEVQLECQKYDYRIDDYKDMGDHEAYIKFSRIITLIKGEQMLQEVELWNPKKEKKEEAIHGDDQEGQENQDPDEIQQQPPLEEEVVDKKE